MKNILQNPINTRILRESMIAGVLVFLLLGLTLPFGLDTIHAGRFSFIVTIGLITFVSAILSNLFTAYVIHMPLDPKLPLRTVHRNSLILYLINTLVTTAAITTYGGFFFYDHPIESWWINGGFNASFCIEYLYYVASTSVFLYIGTYVRNRNWNLHYQLDEVRAINALLEKRQNDIAESAEVASTPTDDTPPTDSEAAKLCTLTGSTAQSVLEVKPENIIYVESMSNYADICYIADDEPQHKTMRITLKQINESLGNHRFLVQCHRAFIVNLNFVVAMSNRTSGYQLQLFGTDRQIPVSRTYTPLVKERLQQ